MRLGKDADIISPKIKLAISNSVSSTIINKKKGSMLIASLENQKTEKRAPYDKYGSIVA